MNSKVSPIFTLLGAIEKVSIELSESQLKIRDDSRILQHNQRVKKLNKIYKQNKLKADQERAQAELQLKQYQEAKSKSRKRPLDHSDNFSKQDHIILEEKSRLTDEGNVTQDFYKELTEDEENLKTPIHNRMGDTSSSKAKRLESLRNEESDPGVREMRESREVREQRDVRGSRDKELRPEKGRIGRIGMIETKKKPNLGEESDKGVKQVPRGSVKEAKEISDDILDKIPQKKSGRAKENEVKEKILGERVDKEDNEGYDPSFRQRQAFTKPIYQEPNDIGKVDHNENVKSGQATFKSSEIPTLPKRNVISKPNFLSKKK